MQQNISNPELIPDTPEDKPDTTRGSLRRKLVALGAVTLVIGSCGYFGDSIFKKVASSNPCEQTLPIGDGNPSDSLIRLPDGTEVYVHAWQERNGNVEVGAGQGILGDFSQVVSTEDASKGYDVTYEADGTNDLRFHVTPTVVTTSCTKRSPVETQQQ